MSSVPAAPRRVRWSESLLRAETYACRFPWPDDVAAQGGRMPGVPQADGTRAPGVAFFEAFPASPDTWLRGEAATPEEAEARCWAWWERVRDCPGHAYDREGRRDGFARCTRCRAAGIVLEPLDRCTVCRVPARYGHDREGQVYCEPHYEALPPDRWADSTRMLHGLDPLLPLP